MSYEACTRCAQIEQAQRIQSDRDEKIENPSSPYDYPQARRWTVKQVNKTSE